LYICVTYFYVCTLYLKKKKKTLKKLKVDKGAESGAKKKKLKGRVDKGQQRWKIKSWTW
jgi:hypothetical protein